MMKLKTLKSYPLFLILTGLITAGCLVSGTFVIIQDVQFDFTANTGFYWYPVDLTADQDWQDNKDNIDFIDAVGFSFDIENTSNIPCLFNVWFKATTGLPDFQNPPVSIPNSATKVINDLSVGANSKRTVTYSESLGMISDLAAFKAIIKTGRFDYYGTSCGGTGDSLFNVTNGKIIITVSASTI